MSNRGEVLHTGLTLDQLRDIHPLRPGKLEDPRPRISTTFELSGPNLDPRECSQILGLEPTASSGIAEEKGKWIPSGRPNVIEPYWRLQFKDRPSDSIDDELAELLELLWPTREALVELVSRPSYSAGFLSSVSIFVDRPIYCLAPETLRRLGYLGLEWCLDIFDYTE